jgi:hypothetical protein
MNRDRGRHLTLVVPALLGPAPVSGNRQQELARQYCDGLSLPALERFFALATAAARQCPEPGLTALLFGCFGVAREGPDWPVAAVTAALDGASEDAGWWLRADPVHLRVDMGGLVLVDSERLRISAAEAEALLAEIHDQIDEPRLRLQALAEKRWYVNLEQAPRLATHAPWDVSGSRIGNFLPRGEDARRWQARINDIQMILHASPVNRAREDRGEPAINSLWLWGGGRTPPVTTSDWQAVWSDCALVDGLAALARADRHKLPEDCHAWLARAEATGNHLLIASAAYVPVRCSDVDAWRDFVSGFEARWMAPLLDALKSGRLQSLSLRIGEGRDFVLRRGQHRRWWRRTRSFARIVSESC